MSRIAKLAIASVIVTIGATTSMAAPVARLDAAAVPAAPAAEKVHHWGTPAKGACRLGRAGWHRHVYGERVPCRPRRYYYY